MKKQDNASLGINDIGREVTLYGWVSKKRDLGGLIFVDLRDRSGIVQLVFRDDNEFYETASNLKSESVIKVVGVVLARENVNDKMKTGSIEVQVNSLEVINSSSPLPFEITDDTNALEDTRLKYRYLDLEEVLFVIK